VRVCERDSDGYLNLVQFCCSVSCRVCCNVHVCLCLRLYLCLCLCLCCMKSVLRQPDYGFVSECVFVRQTQTQTQRQTEREGRYVCLSLSLF